MSTTSTSGSNAFPATTTATDTSGSIATGANPLNRDLQKSADAIPLESSSYARIAKIMRTSEAMKSAASASVKKEEKQPQGEIIQDMLKMMRESGYTGEYTFRHNLFDKAKNIYHIL